MASTQVAQVGGRRLREARDARASSQDSAEKEKSLPTVVAVQQASILCWEGTDTELSQSRMVELTNVE